MRTTKIEWTENTWNPMTGCTKKSLGCVNCYAEKMATRLKAMGNTSYTQGFEFAMHPHLLNKPYMYKKPTKIFVNSMSDTFHEDAPIEFIQKIFQTMLTTSQHTYQLLTKRSSRLLELSNKLDWEKNIWMGVTVEASDYKYRIENLKKTPAKMKFISFEPLLDDIGSVDLQGIDWVIVGGESGPKARPIEERWVLNLKRQCNQANVPFFFKQWGGVNKKKTGRLLEGKIWEQTPQQEFAFA